MCVVCVCRDVCVRMCLVYNLFAKNPTEIYRGDPGGALCKQVESTMDLRSHHMVSLVSIRTMQQHMKGCEASLGDLHDLL